MADADILPTVFYLVLLLIASGVVFSSLNLTRRPTPVRLWVGARGRERPSSLGFRQAMHASVRQGGQILEYLGKLADDYERISTDEEIATPRGAVAIPMAIAVRGEVRVLYPVELPLSAERIDETLRRVALIRRHRFPEARIAFLSERPLPLDLALCASPGNALGRLMSHAVLHVAELRQGRDDATVFREIFRECADEDLSYAVQDLERVDKFLRGSEPISEPITPGLRRLGNLMGRYVEWVIAGRFPERVAREQGKLQVRLDGGELEIDPSSLALEALYSAGRVPLAGFARDLEQVVLDPFFIPREVSPALLQRAPTPVELQRYRRPLPVEHGIVAMRKARLQALEVGTEMEELFTLYQCSCEATHLVHAPLSKDGSVPCRSLAELEGRLMEALQEVAAAEPPRCPRCQRAFAMRDLKLVSVAHPLWDRGVDLWITLDRLPSGKFWWHLTRLRRSGDITHFAGVLTPSTFRRAFGRFFSVKEAWAILFQRVALSLRAERLKAEPGLVLHACPEGIGTQRPVAARRRGFFAPAFLVPLPHEAGSESPATQGERPSFLQDERELRSLGVFTRPPQAWSLAKARPFQRVFEREVRRLGGRWRRRGLSYRVRGPKGGESQRDLAIAIKQTCLVGDDYLPSARALARDAVSEASRVHEYVEHSRRVLGPSVQLLYEPEQGLLRVTGDLAPPTQLPLKSLIDKTLLEDGSFERFLRMAVSQADLGVGLDVCGCGSRAFVSKKVKPRDWPAGSEGRKDDLARQVEGSVSLIYTRDCREHSHYLSLSELKRMGVGLPELEERFQNDIAENSYALTLRVVRVDAHLFFVVAGFNAASITLSGALVRGLLDAARIEVDSPSMRFLATTTGSLALGDPEAPGSAFREAAKISESLLRDAGEPFEPLRHEGLIHIPSVGRGEFRIGAPGA